MPAAIAANPTVGGAGLAAVAGPAAAKPGKNASKQMPAAAIFFFTANHSFVMNAPIIDI
jgi:hypothetical protein